MQPWKDVVGKGPKKYRGMCREADEGREHTEGSLERERLRNVRRCRKGDHQQMGTYWEMEEGSELVEGAWKGRS